MNFDEGIRMLQGYYTPLHTPTKSAPALRKLLTQALRDAHFEQIKALIWEGAELVDSDPHGYSSSTSDWLGYIVCLI